MTAAVAEGPTVAATVRAMRRAGAAVEPVPAETVRGWAATLMDQLYGLQKPVRYECRPRYSSEPWIAANEGDVINARRRDLVVRALYLHPKADQPAKAHRFRDGVCQDCHEKDWLAGPDCCPPAPTLDRRAALPFDPFWFREPLQALQQIATSKVINHYDARRWQTETTYLLERLDQYLKDTQA
ncbi:hypothetical protein [Stenotrophomonas sp. P5_B8]